MKLIELTALDGSKWTFPAQLVVDSYRKHYVSEPSDADLKEWIQNDMDWTEIAPRAVMTGDADAIDMADSLANGKLRVFDGTMPDRPDVPPPGCDGCGASCVAGDAIACTRGPCPMERVAMEDGAVISMAMAVPPDADEIAALALRLSAARAKPAAVDPSLVLGHVALLPEQADGMALALKATKALSKPDMLAIYYAMREDAATILAGIEPGDHSDAILAAFGERVIRAAIHKAAGLSE
jgi:hypothetical protein